MSILGVKKGESKKNYCSVFSFVLLKYCTKRLKMCKNRLYFAVKCPFRSQNRLIIKRLQAKHPTPPLLRNWHPTPLILKIFYFFYFTSKPYFVYKKYRVLYSFRMLFGVKIEYFSRFKNSGFRFGSAWVFLRIKIWLF